jgi:carboxyl-terminal processing protease
MKKKTVYGLVGAAVLGFAFGLVASVSADTASQRASSALPVESVRQLTMAIDRIQRSYVEEVDIDELMEYAIEGMLSSLDPHSDYLTARDFEDMQISTSGKFGGLGIEVGMENGFVKVISPIDDTPAHRAGMKAGDLITMLDDTPVKGLNLREAVDIMRGEPGTDIILTVVRQGESAPIEVTITRDIIKIVSVKSRLLDDAYGYIRVTQFQEKTGDEVAKAVNRLREQSEEPIKGFILDLRNNPGGVLSASVAVADVFLNRELVVYTEGRSEDSRRNYNSTSTTEAESEPLVVLINGGSASASEIVAGAIKDHERGLLMGTRSFGKGSVQSIMPVSEDSAIKLTTARYYTPDGISIQAQGIDPDIEVQQGTFTAVDELRYSEADLDGHLENENGDVTTGQSNEEVSDLTADVASDKGMADDHQLQQALVVLKGLAILQ